MHFNKFMNRTTIDISSKTIIKLIAIFLLGWFLYFIRDIIVIFFITIVIASALEGPVKWLRKYHIPRPFGVVLVYLIFLGVLISSIYLLIPPIVQEARDLSQKLPEFYDSVIPRVQGMKDFSARHHLLESFQGAISNLTKNLSNFSGSVFGTIFSIFGGVFSFVVILTISFYMIVQKNAFKKFLRTISPAEHQPYITSLMNRIQEKIGNWLRAQIFLAFIIGFFTFIGLSILGMPYAFILSIFAGIMEVIPYVGPMISVVPAIFLAAATGNWFLVIGVIVLYIIIQQLENHLIVPKVMHKALGLNPIVVILSLLIGAKIAGFLGMILAVPVATASAVFLGDFLWHRQDNSDAKVNN